VAPRQKVRYDKGGDDKVLNEAGLVGVSIVTPNWNKIIVVEGGIKVKSHWRVQPIGSRKNPTYKLKQIKEFQKSGLIRRGGTKKQSL
jgi:hypothetical protein